MKLLLLVIAVHFTAGALGFVVINRRLTPEESRRNWLKYLVYLLIFIIVLGSVLIDKHLFLGVTIFLLSSSLLEILMMGRNRVQGLSGKRVIPVAVSVFSIAGIFFSVFVLLPNAVIAYAYTLVVIFDGGSQIYGQLAGKHKILPAVSPGKTWEGFAGGTISTIVTAVILHEFAGFSVLFSAGFGLLVSISSVTGDLAASGYKRFFGAKDFGNVLPGQGGILDRFDSFFAVGAVIGILNIPSIITLSVADKNIALYLGFSIVLVFIVLTGEVIRYLFHLRAEYSRIFAHLFAGIACLMIVNRFSSHWYVVAICIQSSIFLLISKKMNLFDSHHNVARDTNGSSIFFMGVLAAYILSIIRNDIFLFIIPVAVLTLSDPVASVAGMNCRSGNIHIAGIKKNFAKTWTGSLGFFISAALIIYAGLFIFYDQSFLMMITVSISVSFFSAIAEAVSEKGTDNFWIPLVSGVSLAFFQII